MMCNGDFLHKDPDEAIDFLNELAEKAHTWTGPSVTNSTNRPKQSGIYHLREEDNFKAQLQTLTRELEALKMKESRNTQTIAKIDSQGSCFVCGESEHLAQDSPTHSEMRGVYEEHCNTLGMFRKPLSPYSDTYNPGWRSHPNFNWKYDFNQPTPPGNNWRADPQAQPLQRSYQPLPYNAPKLQDPLQDMIQAFIEMRGKTNQKVEQVLTHMVEKNKEIEGQNKEIQS